MKNLADCDPWLDPESPKLAQELVLWAHQNQGTRPAGFYQAPRRGFNWVDPEATPNGVRSTCLKSRGLRLIFHQGPRSYKRTMSSDLRT